jgi:hypothetical protein
LGGYCVRQDNHLSKSSFAIFRNKFDEDDQLVESAYFDGNEHPVLGFSGAFQEKVAYDLDGNITEFAAYGTDGRPIITTMGFHKKISEFKNGRDPDRIPQRGWHTCGAR